jgi:hypothetical protein
MTVANFKNPNYFQTSQVLHNYGNNQTSESDGFDQKEPHRIVKPKQGAIYRRVQ